MDPFISFTPPSGTHVGPLKIIFKGLKKRGHTHAHADHPAHARADHPSTMKREDMHARADQPAHAHADHRSAMKREEMHACADHPAQWQPAPLVVLSHVL